MYQDREGNRTLWSRYILGSRVELITTTTTGDLSPRGGPARESTFALSRCRKHQVRVHNLNSETEEQASVMSESRISQAQHIGNLCPRSLTVHRHNVA